MNFQCNRSKMVFKHYNTIITHVWKELHIRTFLTQLSFKTFLLLIKFQLIHGPHQANLVLIAYASSEGSGEPPHPRSLARTFAARSYKQ